jgi:hypothetical protein
MTMRMTTTKKKMMMLMMRVRMGLQATTTRERRKSSVDDCGEWTLAWRAQSGRQRVTMATQQQH